MSYSLQGLVRCDPLPNRPNYIPLAKLRGARARGVSFERGVGRVLASLYTPVHSGRWFQYHDRNRSGVCQVDHYVVLRDRVLLVECKLSECTRAWVQMANLYAPILALTYDLPVVQIQAVRHLKSGRLPISDIRDATLGRDALWHVLV